MYENNVEKHTYCRVKSRIHRGVLIAGLVLFASLLGACQSEDEPTTGMETGFVWTIETVDIVGADTLFIGMRQGDTSPQLYKTVDGAVIRVDYLNVEGQRFQLVEQLREMHDVNGDYLVLEFSGTDARITRLLVQKNTGTVFVMDQENRLVPRNQTFQFTNAPVVLTDNAGNLYYLQGGGDADDSQRIAKIDLSDEDNPKHQVLTNSKEHVIYFAVGPDGLIIYNAITPVQAVTRAILPNGNLTAAPEQLFHYWTGINGLFANRENRIYTLSAVDGEVVETEYAVGFEVSKGSLVTQVTFSDRLILIGERDPFIEIENPQDAPRFVPNPFERIFAVVQTDEYIYISGTVDDIETNIVRIDLRDTEFSHELILEEGLYEVTDMRVAADGRIRFEVTQTIGEAINRVGLIEADGSIQFVEETPFDGELRSLIRLP